MALGNANVVLDLRFFELAPAGQDIILQCSIYA